MNKKIALIAYFYFFSTNIFSAEQLSKQGRTTNSTNTEMYEVYTKDKKICIKFKSPRDILNFIEKEGTRDFFNGIDACLKRWETFWKQCVNEYQIIFDANESFPEFSPYMLLKLSSMMLVYNEDEGIFFRKTQLNQLDPASYSVIDHLLFYHADSIFEDTIFDHDTSPHNVVVPFLKRQLSQLREKESDDMKSHNVESILSGKYSIEIYNQKHEDDI